MYWCVSVRASEHTHTCHPNKHTLTQCFALLCTYSARDDDADVASHQQCASRIQLILYHSVALATMCAYCGGVACIMARVQNNGMSVCVRFVCICSCDAKTLVTLPCVCVCSERLPADCCNYIYCFCIQ